MEKNGMLTPDSMSDFDSTKKAEYIDKESPLVADEANKSKLKKPERYNWYNIEDELPYKKGGSGPHPNKK
jgi:hypothetical protein